MTSKEYFEGVRQSRVRADELKTRAEELKKHAGDARGMRYERPIIGKQKNGAVYIDAMADAIQRLQKASVAAYSASELAMTYVAEAGEVLESMLESSDADVTAIAILWDYYIDVSEKVLFALVKKTKPNIKATLTGRFIIPLFTALYTLMNQIL